MFLRRSHTERVSDEDLVTLLRNGDQASLGYLWDRYAHLLFGVGMKYLKDSERSKDVVVELFADLPALLKKHSVQRFRPWLHAVMRNRCLLALRNERPTTALPEELLRTTQQEEQESAILHEAELQHLEQAIDQLGDGQRICIRMFYLEKHSYQHVADTTGYPVEQVRSHLQNGRRNLRLILERHVHRTQ
jgi:RNA polymerase sigma-70 factor (ECF subfamily)